MIIQKFGLELRTAKSINDLYGDVDKVLKRASTDGMKVATVAHALQKMLHSDNHFSVCTINACASICRIIIPKERMEIYDASHCLHWNEMLEDFRKTLIAYILDDFRSALNPHEIENEEI